MTSKRALYASTMAAGVGLAGVFGVGLGTASAQPAQPCGAPHGQACGPGQQRDNRAPAPAPSDWHGRGVDQGRNDHRPFNWHGQQVTPMPAGNGHGWGFWFLGTWIPL
jgi:hypothetical protein